ncbi:endonuclease/exonuclease/phosphatase family protein [Plantactinospora sp. B5E13]|uniref:endonuclease/exonuclease/phosphatase family protein n=1 Tax=Plantactinospora sp. B5E13 TaxID=3153758 RepID=UPI00325C9189
MIRRFRTLLAAVVVVATLFGPATPVRAHGPQRLTVATYNLYQGADLTGLLTAPTLPELVERAGLTYQRMVDTDFPTRARAIARLLAKTRPDVLGLQEVALWKKGPLGGPLQVSYDFLDILLRELRGVGLHYRTAATVTMFTGTLPISATEQASFSDRNALLIRDGLQASNPRSHLYEATVVVDTPAGITFDLPSGWIAVDVGATRHDRVRVATTHLEPSVPAVRDAQGRELYAALAGSPYPVIVAGDLNSPPTDPTGPYGTFATGGYRDAWRVVNGVGGGFTATQDPDLRNLPSQLDERVDHVFHQPGRLWAVNADLVGEAVRDRTPTGLWPSDHAGLVVTFRRVGR